jgi:threonine/homoserine/homoserine lactone efflux protein
VIDGQLFGAGVIIGVAVAAPIGPINLMAIRNTLAGGFWRGVSTGAGAVLGDGSFAFVAAFGLTAVSEFVLAYATWIQVAGGLLLIAVGLHTMFMHDAAPRASIPAPANGARARTVALLGTTYLLTVTNPATMMGFIAIFSSVGGLAARPSDYGAAATLVSAVMAGSALWWCLIAWFASRLQSRMADGWFRYVNWASGAVIALFGAGVLARLAW